MSSLAGRVAVVMGIGTGFPVADGVPSDVDFGSHGEGVLLARGSGHNSAAWMAEPRPLSGFSEPRGARLSASTART